MKTTPLLLTEFGGAASADVDAPADQVFAAITDIARLPERNALIRRALERAAGSAAPGSAQPDRRQLARQSAHFWRCALFSKLRRRQIMRRIAGLAMHSRHDAPPGPGTPGPVAWQE